MGPFGGMGINSGNGRNVPVYAISAVHAFTFHESTSPWTGWGMYSFVEYLGKKRSV